MEENKQEAIQDILERCAEIRKECEELQDKQLAELDTLRKEK